MKNPRPAREAGRGGCGSAGRHDHRPSSAFDHGGASARPAAYSSEPSGLALPADAAVRLHIRHEGYLVCVARPPLQATPEALSTSTPGQVHAVLTHDAGCSWPDRVGELFAEEALAAGGAAVLVFASLADALACRQRLEGAPRR
jgi:hypothetical protein